MMKKNPHVIWVCPANGTFFRSKGEVRSRSNSVLPKLASRGFHVNVLIPYDRALLPKTKLPSSRIIEFDLSLFQGYKVRVYKLSKSTQSPGLYMVDIPAVEPAIANALFSKAALALAQHLKKPVDIFHLFDWRTALLPLYLEMERGSNSYSKQARTFLNMGPVNGEGYFAPGMLKYLKIPDELFHPEGIEFFGQVSFIKTGLLFSDGVGLVETRPTRKNGQSAAALRYQGVLDAQAHKLRRWASDRALHSYLEAYNELLNLPKLKPLFPTLLNKLHANSEHAKDFIESWGPVPKNRYQTNRISFLIQSPRKAYVFWEWNEPEHKEIGIILVDHDTDHRSLIARRLSTLSDYWIDLKPNRRYSVELVGWTAAGVRHTLLKSRVVRTPRDSVSSRAKPVFIDVRTGQSVPLKEFPSLQLWRQKHQTVGGGSEMLYSTTSSSLDASKKR